MVIHRLTHTHTHTCIFTFYNTCCNTPAIAGMRDTSRGRKPPFNPRTILLRIDEVLALLFAILRKRDLKLFNFLSFEPFNFNFRSSLLTIC